MPGFDLLVVGEINPDLILRGSNLTPAFGQAEKLIEHADLTMGSSAAIVACGAAKLGLKTAFVGIVGDDVFGHFMLDAMKQKGIDTSNCIVDPSLATGFSLIFSEPRDRAILTYPGSIASLRLGDINLKLLGQAKHLHLSSFFLLDKLRPDISSLFKQAKEEGLTTSLDTNWDPGESWNDGLWEVLNYTDIFLPNEEELLRITDAPGLDSALNKLRGKVPTLAVKLGAKGGLALQNQQEAKAPIIPVELVDTTGAGDSFNAGFLYAYLQNWPLQKGLQFACICGSLSTRSAGGTSSQATLDEAFIYMPKDNLS